LSIRGFWLLFRLAQPLLKPRKSVIKIEAENRLDEIER
jgi:hypothetical protein